MEFVLKIFSCNILETLKSHGLHSAVVLLAVLYCSQARAGQIGVPIFDPNTQSYFELRDDNSRQYWREARRLAAVSLYKGRRGRLAVVNSKETNDFLRSNFTLTGPAWIGLRYWCKTRKLRWVTGERHLRTGYNNWYRPWNRNPETTCGITGSGAETHGYMPVYYLPQNFGFRWQAAGPGKGFIRYFVEYPTVSK